MNEKGQIIADYGMRWVRSKDYYHSISHYGYFIAPNGRLWTLYKEQNSSLKHLRSNQRIFTGHSVRECMQVAEIWIVQETHDIKLMDWSKLPHMRGMSDSR